MTTIKDRLQKISNASKIAEAWIFYANMNDFRANTEKYKAAQHAFILGAKSMLGDEGLPAIISVYVMSGRDIAEIPKIMAERNAQEPVA